MMIKIQEELQNTYIDQSIRCAADESKMWQTFSWWHNSYGVARKQLIESELLFRSMKFITLIGCWKFRSNLLSDDKWKKFFINPDFRDNLTLIVTFHRLSTCCKFCGKKWKQAELFSENIAKSQTHRFEFQPQRLIRGEFSSCVSAKWWKSSTLLRPFTLLKLKVQLDLKFSLGDRGTATMIRMQPVDRG